MKITRWIALVLAAFASSVPAQTISWDGGGDGVSWSDPLNWAGEAIPGATNDVVINIPLNAAVVSGSNVIIRSVQCTGGLTITNSDFTRQAREDAAHVGCQLIDGATIPDLIRGDLL